MNTKNAQRSSLSVWWWIGVAVTVLAGFSILIYISVKAYRDSPPIPEKVVNAEGDTVFTGEDILSGQQVFLKYGLMENGTVWGHGAYLGPDFSAAYLHSLAVDVAEDTARKRYQQKLAALEPAERDAVEAETRRLLKKNRFDPQTKTLLFTESEENSYRRQISRWQHHFSQESRSGGLPPEYLNNRRELEQLTAFFAWTAWAAAANRPNASYSYTNNFPYDPLAGNTPTRRRCSLECLESDHTVGGNGGNFVCLRQVRLSGVERRQGTLHPRMLPGEATESQRATLKYFVIVALFFLAQVLVGGAAAHFRAEPGAILWIRFIPVAADQYFTDLASAAGDILDCNRLYRRRSDAGFLPGQKEPRGSGEMDSICCSGRWCCGRRQPPGRTSRHQSIPRPRLWFWFGHQGWEYLDLGRGWQVLLVAGLVFWLILLFRFVAPGFERSGTQGNPHPFLLAALAIPLFYLPAFFFGSRPNFIVVDNWRFWIIHLWVEGFFELFVTVMVAVTFFRLGMVSRQDATRVIYLDAILFLAGRDHRYRPSLVLDRPNHFNMALSALFSAMEVVPLTLLTLDAWDFVRLTHSGKCDAAAKRYPCHTNGRFIF